jgi:chromosome segregation ATPase
MLHALLGCKRRTLLDSRDNLDRLYRDASNSLTILERIHHFTMSELDHHRDELRASQTEVSRLGKLLSSKDYVIKELRTSKKLVTQELEAAHHNIKALEDDRVVMKAMYDKAMEKVVRIARILMRRPGVVVPGDIVADVLTASAGVSKPSSFGNPASEVPCKNAPTQ